MGRRIVALALGFLLVAPPLSAMAETRVYLNIGIGGAVALGGGFLLWNIQYAQRLSQKLPAKEPEKGLARLDQTRADLSAPPSEVRLDQRIEIASTRLELPLFSFQW